MVNGKKIVHVVSDGLLKDGDVVPHFHGSDAHFVVKEVVESRPARGLWNLSYWGCHPTWQKVSVY